ncbi:hypothetical protein PRUPE_1G584500 [Prunus persica]|uniref:Uncharacterized protein n=1 Tax=Prunus persica TaxID=3760 RepID=A0A251RK88_PRUPE|nr:hypothetical protein PRUPE_1G584500 [Prunus persica]
MVYHGFHTWQWHRRWHQGRIRKQTCGVDVPCCFTLSIYSFPCCLFKLQARRAI